MCGIWTLVPLIPNAPNFAKMIIEPSAKVDVSHKSGYHRCAHLARDRAVRNLTANALHLETTTITQLLGVINVDLSVAFSCPLLRWYVPCVSPRECWHDQGAVRGRLEGKVNGHGRASSWPSTLQNYMCLKNLCYESKLILLWGSETQSHCVYRALQVAKELKVAEIEIPPSFRTPAFLFQTVHKGRVWSPISVQGRGYFAKSLQVPTHLSPLARIPESCWV